MSPRKKRPAIAVKVGDRVLVGRPGISLPDDWFFATVLWTDGGEEILTEHQDANGQNVFRSMTEISCIRAVGNREHLSAFKERCVRELREASNRVRDAEMAVGKARDAVWKRLDELCAARGDSGQ